MRERFIYYATYDLYACAYYLNYLYMLIKLIWNWKKIEIENEKHLKLARNGNEPYFVNVSYWSYCKSIMHMYC